jgi:hypothetical protein
MLFIEDKSFGYRERTIKNATADATIAFAMDFNTAGERLTKKAAQENGKVFIPLNLKNSINETEKIINALNKIKKDEIVLNIAGNGIYSLTKFNMTQEFVDEMIFMVLDNVIKSTNLKPKVVGIRTGGQTGADEAGAKAGERLLLPTLVLAPKGWKFRNLEGVDICDETLFKKRFSNCNEEYIK